MVEAFLNEVIGIVGLGGIGCTLARLFSAKAKVIGYDRDLERALACSREYNVGVAGSLGEVLEGSSIVVLAVPPGVLGEVLGSIGELVNRGVNTERSLLVTDTATYKTPILPIYNQLPLHIQAAGMHPLFGPGAKDPSKHTIIVTRIPERKGAERLTRLLSNLGFRTRILDPYRHDKIVSRTIGYSYIIGLLTSLILNELDLSQEELLELGGTTFQLLNIHHKAVLNDIITTGRYVLDSEPTREVALNASRLLAGVAGGGLEGFSLFLEDYIDGVGLEDIGEAYRVLYRFLELLK